MWIEKNITRADLTAGGTYQFTYSYKSNETITPGGMGITLKNSSIDITIPHPTFSGDGSWHTFTNTFTLPSDVGSTDPLLRIHFCIAGIVDWWIDNISIVKI